MSESADMPDDLRQMEAMEMAGIDPDDIPGIERLWLYRWDQRAQEFAEVHRQFFEWLKSNPA